MIVYDLECVGHRHRFEGWFASSDDFTRQQERGLVACPQCGAAQVVKAPMAPRLTRKGNQAQPAPTPEIPPEAKAKLQEALTAIAKAQAEALKSSHWVGKDFAHKARAMHYGDAPAQPIHGQASPEEAKSLVDEGVEIAPILFPVAPPDAIN